MLCCTACGASDDTFDIVLVGGRVIDPETHLDGVRNVGIRGDRIAAITTEPLRGSRILDVQGLVVAPGFIDLHQHAQDQAAYRVMALDGITTALDLENGVPDVRRFVAARAGRSLIHFGASASHRAARLLAWDLPLPVSLDGPEAGLPAPRSGPVTNDPATLEQLERIRQALKAQLDAGAPGIGMGLEYLPGTTRHEVIEVFRLAAEYGVPVFVHARGAGTIEPGSSVEAVNELIGAAAISGAALHVVHINSTCLRDATVCLSMIRGARERGLDVTTEAYPYTAAMTVINSAFFSPGWRERRGLDYGDLELPESGERLTEARFEALHGSAQPRRVLIHMNPDAVVDAILADSLVVIASDGLTAHPRGAGTHARVLARYVRGQGTMT
ncbi:MAG TPA: amidohydrolase family protein, partial [Longimicrobiales bacterium]|nr:amidohydrolase family protein [Longimicrobiales bacterium]